MSRCKQSGIFVIVSLVVVCCLNCAVMAKAGKGSWPFEISVVHKPGTYWW